MTTTIKEMTPQYITFEVDSHSRDLKHEIIFNRITREWSCTCEDYWYRKRACKHTRECKALLNSLIFECSSSKAYKGETLTTEEIKAKA
jgi:hypothetical protein